MLKIAICDDERCMQITLEALVDELGEKYLLELEIEMLDSGIAL